MRGRQILHLLCCGALLAAFLIAGDLYFKWGRPMLASLTSEMNGIAQPEPAATAVPAPTFEAAYLAAQAAPGSTDAERVRSAVDTYFTLQYESIVADKALDLSIVVDETTEEGRTLLNYELGRLQYMLFCWRDYGHTTTDYDYHPIYESMQVKGDTAVVHVCPWVDLWRVSTPHRPDTTYGELHVITLVQRPEGWRIVADDHSNEWKQAWPVGTDFSALQATYSERMEEVRKRNAELERLYGPLKKQLEGADSPTATAAAIPTSATPAPNAVAGPASSTSCGTLSISLPKTARFAPVADAAGAIAYSDDGLKLAFPETGATVPVHPLGNDTKEADRSFAWSPDGRQIAFVHALYGPPLECQLGYPLLADLDLGEVSVVLPHPGVYGQPVWSPDGDRLAFVRVTQPGLGELSVLHVAGGTQIALAESASSWPWLAPAWLDDEHVLYARVNEADPQRLQLVSQPLDGGHQRIVVPAEETFGLKTFAFSSQARQVAFNRDSEVALVDVDSGAITPVGTMPEVLRLFWAADGRHILGQAGLGDLYLAQIDSPSPAVHLDFSGVAGQSQPWAPDSLRLALMVGSAPRLGVYDVGEQALDLLPVAVGRPWELAWSPR